MITLNDQLSLFDKKTPIQTVKITPTKEMPLDFFKVCYRLSYYMELMERLPDGRVIWDEEVGTMFDENMADVLYAGLQNDWFKTPFELPKKFFDENLNPES